MKTDVKSNEMNFSGNPETVTYWETQRVIYSSEDLL